MSPSTATGGHLFIPDLHGHLARLEAALTVARQLPDAHLVFLGDLIDDSPRRRSERGDHRERGVADDSREILRQVRQLVGQGRATVLLGNHEVMAIATVLEGHWQLQEIWWANGGRETAAGYGWRGQGAQGPLADDLVWLREHARLWALTGPPSAQVLAAHATRPHPERLTAGANGYDALHPLDTFDPVVWFALEVDALGRLPTYALPESCTASVHGHMEDSHVRQHPGPDGRPAIQLDLGPAKKKLALLYLDTTGRHKIITQAVR